MSPCKSQTTDHSSRSLNVGHCRNSRGSPTPQRRRLWSVTGTQSRPRLGCSGNKVGTDGAGKGHEDLKTLKNGRLAKRQEITSVGEVAGKKEPRARWVGVQTGAAAVGNGLQGPQKLKTDPPHAPATPLPGVFPEEMETGFWKNTCITTFIAALLTMAKWRNSLGACA